MTYTAENCSMVSEGGSIPHYSGHQPAFGSVVGQRQSAATAHMVRCLPRACMPPCRARAQSVKSATLQTLIQSSRARALSCSIALTERASTIRPLEPHDDVMVSYTLLSSKRIQKVVG